MEGEKALSFIIGRQTGSEYVNVMIPATAAIVTVMFLGGTRHHPSACSVVGELAMVITDEQIKSTLDISMITSAISMRAGLSDNRHHPVKSRFVGSPVEPIFAGRIHPMELYGVAISCEAFIDDIDRDAEETVYNSLVTWTRGASRFVGDREMLAIYEKEAIV